MVRGIIERAGTVDAPVGRHPTVRTRMAVVNTGKPARTHYRVLEHFVACTLIECALETGRTHQIRVHMASIDHPLVGDPTYGAGVSRVPQGAHFPRQALHACRLALVHPVTGRPLLWRSGLPADMAVLITTLRGEAMAARCTEEEGRSEDEDDDDWDDDQEGGPEIIYVSGDDPEDDDLGEQ